MEYKDGHEKVSSWWSEDAPLESDVSVEALESFVKQIKAQRDSIDELKEEIKKRDAVLLQMETKAMQYLKQLKKDSYKSEYGTLGIMHRLSINLPRTPEDKQAFFQYLKDKNLFDQMISVNSNTLISWYKQEYEIAKEEKRLSSFSIPGLKEPTLIEKIYLRGAKT